MISHGICVVYRASEPAQQTSCQDVKTPTKLVGVCGIYRITHAIFVDCSETPTIEFFDGFIKLNTGVA